jgi:hypothetical protein
MAVDPWQLIRIGVKIPFSGILVGSSFMLLLAVTLLTFIYFP